MGTRIGLGLLAVCAAMLAAPPAAWGAPTWTLQPTANLGKASAELNGVSCVSATRCVGVGVTSTTVGAALAEQWNGTSWVRLPTPNPPGAQQSYLDSVACASTTACMAVGTTETGTGDHEPLAEAWNGTKWTIVPTPTVHQSFLNAVACSAAGACIAVGGQPGAQADVPLALAWNGKVWAVHSPPNPSKSVNSALDGISCLSAVDCVTVGSQQQGSTTMTLAEVWNGKSWSVVPTPDVAGYGSVLSDVSCYASTACAAVGSYGVGLTTWTLALWWNGRTWKIVASPSPSPVKSSSLMWVRCVSATSCEAVGTYENARKASQALAEAGGATAFVVQATPAPAPATGAQLDGVSCTAATACTSVGWYVGSSGTSTPFAERYSG